MAGGVEDVLVDGVVVGKAFEEGGAGCDGAGVGGFVEGAKIVYGGCPWGGGVEEGRVDVEAVLAWWMSAIRVGHVGCSVVVVSHSWMSNVYFVGSMERVFHKQEIISCGSVWSCVFIGSSARLMLLCQSSRA